MKKILTFLMILTLALFLVACNDDENGTDDTGQVEITNDERLDEDESVVRVNDTEIKGDKYNQIYTQVKLMMDQYGQDVSDLDLVKEQSVSILVEQELINQDAKNLGIEVTDEEAQIEIDTMKEETDEEQFSQVLKTYQITEDEFKNQLVDDLVTVKYMDHEFDVEVTDEEIEEYYNQLKEQNPERIAELDTEEVEEEIKSILSRQEQSEQLAERVAELRESAEIEILI
ncbi:SurA N-terminal domain-containing protein [Oceanobacillus bengalensis]|uniref:Peptidylprolyl isomerase n=1 Tax=Oceanobacillus bengalensis TaxID=1435466 RepID=A0A494Z2Y5_9BACI|nr:SurA N-terminal domain-containing protein [Oceanobacillus bengalensis]RKQ16880.1 hypothetical protein D8M05_06410 [Oceanobacillus bengalensis]